MRERSILFARPLVLALLAGRKTQTRRLIVPQPQTPKNQFVRGWDVAAAGQELTCPFGIPGDRLWVREKWGYERQFFDRGAKAGGPVIYAADGNPPRSHFVPWKPSLHMPRSASRLVLEVTGISAEPLTQIDLADAAAEGCPTSHANAPLDWFTGIWNEYYNSRGLGWAANPWVWVVRFKVITPTQVTSTDTAEPRPSFKESSVDVVASPPTPGTERGDDPGLGPETRVVASLRSRREEP